MATNEILRFAETDTGTNLLTQAEYLADAQRPIGNQPGVARSKLVNKALRQASLIAAGLAEYIADNQANNVTDALTPQNIADYLQAAITGALGVTPPQFDNDTSLATTAFVQRALGSLSGNRTVSTETLTAADAGRYLTVNASATITMPLANSVPIGTAIHFAVNNSGVVANVRRNGSDTFGAGSTGSSADIVLGGGDTLTLVSDGNTVWYPIAGSGALPASTGIFAKSLASSGYQKLPSGLIIQWGEVAPGTPTAFPIAFPTTCYTLAIAYYGASGTSPPNWSQMSVATSTTTITPHIYADRFRYIAIGK